MNEETNQLTASDQRFLQRYEDYVPCSLVEMYQPFGGTCSSVCYPEDRDRSVEFLVSMPHMYQATLCHIPQSLLSQPTTGQQIHHLTKQV
jgi:hypothetical protein